MKWLVPLLMFVLVLAGTVRASDNPEYLRQIVAGERIGDAKLGMTRDELARVETRCEVREAKFGADGRAIWLETGNAPCPTVPGNIMVGSHGKEDLIEALGDQYERVLAERYPHATAYWYRYAIGIEFFMLEMPNGSTQVTGVAIFARK